MAKKVVGSKEWCAFPELNLPAVKARVDSGAKTSSIHAFNIRTFKRDGVSWVSFDIHPLQKNRRTNIRCESPVVDKRSVKSSSGVAEERYVIATPVTLGGDTWNIELTLTNRDSMGYRMLLGREAMAGHILIDPGRSYRQGKISAREVKELYGLHKR